jgi:hypothetical protein
MENTLGQVRVKADFNPAKNEVVDQIKNKSAELIDLIQLFINDEAVNPNNETHEAFNNSEKVRVARIAQEYIETGCMYAVKANFTK